MRIQGFFAMVLALSCEGNKPSRHVECSVRYATTTQRVEVLPTAAPYDSPSQPIGERFAFKAVLRDGVGANASLGIYVYARGSDGDVLLQQVKYVPPYPGAHANAPFGFTGHQFVYSHDARELEYWCSFRSP